MTASEIKSLLAKNKFKEALKALKSEIQKRKASKETENEYYHHEGQYESYKKAKRLSIISFDEIGRLEAQLRINLLAFVDVVFDEPSNTSTVALIMDMEGTILDGQQEQRIKTEIAKILSINTREVIIRNIRTGSIIIDIELPKEAARRLKMYYDTNKYQALLKNIRNEFQLSGVFIPEFKYLGGASPKGGISSRFIQLLTWKRMGIAASIVGLLGIGIWFLSNPSKGEMIETKTLSQEKTTIDLPDGTKVWLNQNSSLKYEKQFDKRIVHLVGEAYFEVVEGRPFEIFAGGAKTEILGTSLNLRAYPEEASVEVAVKEGRVRFILVQDPASGIILSEGDFGVYEKKTSSVEKKGEKGNAIAWKTGTISFKDTPISEIMVTLERYYGVKIIVNNEDLLSCPYTLPAVDNPVLEELLEGISYTTAGRLRYTIDEKNETIYLEGEGCK